MLHTATTRLILEEAGYIRKHSTQLLWPTTSARKQSDSIIKMADLLSISASIAGLLSITESIIRNRYHFIRACKEAEETVLLLVNEVNSLARMLYSLRNIVQRFEDDNTTIEPTTQIHHIESCYQTLRKVQAVLEKANPAKSSGGLNTAIRKLRWPLTKSETKELITEVERYNQVA